MFLFSLSILSILNLCLSGLNFLQKILHFALNLIVVCNVLAVTLQKLQLIKQGSYLLILHEQLALKHADFCLLVGVPLLEFCCSDTHLCDLLVV